MKRWISISLLLVIVSLVGVGIGLAKGGPNNNVDKSDYVSAGNLIADIPKGTLSKEEVESLVQMREEEKLARDVYLALFEKWNLNIFANIAKSEQTHTDAVKALLDRYGIEDPVKDDTRGVFTSEKMQKLYNDLVAQGSKSLEDALKVGATVEDLDIKDLEDFLKITDNEDIKIVYQNLMKGSRNHLRAFIRNIERNGDTYTPQFITKEEYERIISSDWERGAVDANGNLINKGNGNGNGNGKGNKKGKGKGNGHGNGKGNRYHGRNH